MPNRGRRAVHRLGRQHGTQPGSPAVQQHPLVAVGDAEHRSYLVGGEVLDVVEHDNPALRVGQFGQQRQHALSELGRNYRVVDLIGPLRERDIATTVATEALCEVWFGSAGATLFRQRRAGAVEQHSIQPRPERRPTLESLDAANDGQPSLLSDFLGNGSAADRCVRQPKEPQLVPIDERDERGLVAVLHPGDKLGVVIHG